ncbi:MAG: 3-deoxy-D-manno-octulosonic acid transferase [Hyphomicrobiales bacterium]|nr:3-deoxy-D-manno-octulosonic acid transferase [Hyphomicrobiales bacterium]
MRPAPLTLYRALSAAASPLADAFLRARAARGLEDPERIGERKGESTAMRPIGPVFWLHGASIGETLALTPLIEQLVQAGVFALATGGTVGAAQALTRRLPGGAAHQFLPLDTPRFMRRFLDRWRPNLALFAESELWPNAIIETRKRSIPMMLVNARLSERSAARWARAPKSAAALLEAFDVIFAQSEQEARRFAALGAQRIRIAGNTKFDAPAPPADRQALAALIAEIGARPVWVAASTHEGEEEICLAAHRALAARYPNLLTIIAPRDARRGAQIAALATRSGFVATRRAQAQTPQNAHVHVADTFGDMGLWLRLAGVVFIGQTLNGGGGHSPIEAARLGSAILHGPSTQNFASLFDALDAHGGGLMAQDASSLAYALDMLLSDARRLRASARAAGAVVERLSGATQVIMNDLAPYLPRREDRMRW